MSIHKMNCLGFALGWWKEEAEYKIWYNSDHAINIDQSTQVMFKGYREFLPLETFGLEAIYNSHKANLNKAEKELLIEYFRRYNRNSYVNFVKELPTEFEQHHIKSEDKPKCRPKKEKSIEYSDEPVKFFHLVLNNTYVTLMGAEPYKVTCIEIDLVNFKAKFEWINEFGSTSSHWYNLGDLKDYIRDSSFNN